MKNLKPLQSIYIDGDTEIYSPSVETKAHELGIIVQDELNRYNLHLQVEVYEDSRRRA